MIAICDYDAGNIRSVQRACTHLGYEYTLTRDRNQILSADHLILPGVGSFGNAMEKLQEYGIDSVLHEVNAKGTPILGICLGLQLFFEGSEESPGVKGLGLMKGNILRIPDQNGTLKIPHMGWNSLSYPCKGRLFEGIPEHIFVYFVHSYYLPVCGTGTEGNDGTFVTAAADYGVMVGASVEKDNLFACQFHPEKSSEWGLKILDNFLKV